MQPPLSRGVLALRLIRSVIAILELLKRVGYFEITPWKMDSKEEILSALDGTYVICSVQINIQVLFPVRNLLNSLCFLSEFNRKATDKVPPLLERYLHRIAATGETL